MAIYEIYSHIKKGKPYPPKDPKKLPQEVAKDLQPYLSVQRWKNNDLHIVLKDAVTSEETQNTKTETVNDRLKSAREDRTQSNTTASSVVDALPYPNPDDNVTGPYRRIPV